MYRKNDFPVYQQDPNLIYLDSAATTQKPDRVIGEMADCQAFDNGSPHRGAHRLSVLATQRYDQSRRRVASFIDAAEASEVVFTKNATESLNLLAYGYGLHEVKAGQKIVLSITNHHSNILPWQMVAKQTGAELTYLYVDAAGRHLPGELDKIDDRTAIVAFPMISNGIGIKHDTQAILAKTRAVGAVSVVDAAQAVGHMPVSVQALDCDFLVFSGHKLYGPQGIGVLYGKKAQLERVRPFLLGGDMIEYVEEQQATYASLPNRLEAGTQNVTGAVGLAEAILYLEEVGPDRVYAHEEELVAYALKTLSALDFVDVYGPGVDELDQRGALVTFNVQGVHPHDVATLLDEQSIAIRAGHHCCQPLMKHLNLSSTCRASFSIYSQKSDVDALVKGLQRVREVFGYGQ